jgi:N-acetylglucosaminyldiphosphoundecaprenol N-acetyl-beta-D-mannosaminyltransferase
MEPGVREERMRTDILGVGFDDLTMDEAVAAASECIDSRRGAYVVTPNPEIVWLCRKEPGLRRALDGAALVLPDGIGVVYAARILGRPLKGKVAGIDFAAGLMKELAVSGKSVYLLGAKPGVAEAAAETLKERYKGLLIAGTADGYFKDDGPVIDDINGKKPDFLMVCLGAPKQEHWMAENAGKLDVGLMAGLGGSLDVFAGTVRRAPQSWQNLHLEWLFRLFKEPRRFTRMMKLPLFLFAVIWRRVGGKS